MDARVIFESKLMCDVRVSWNESEVLTPTEESGVTWGVGRCIFHGLLIYLFFPPYHPVTTPQTNTAFLAMMLKIRAWIFIPSFFFLT